MRSKTKYVLYWHGQNMFGPFSTRAKAEAWAVLRFGIYWFRNKTLRIWALEKP